MTRATMDRGCPHGFDETLVTGYLDRMLTQGDRQRVEIHLQTCASCREVLDTLRSLRTAARSTGFQVPPDHQWKEGPRSRGSRWSRGMGWLLAILWAVVMGAVGLLQIAISGQPLWEKLAIFGGLAGGGFLLLSVLLDRLHDLEGDRYRRVQK